LQDGADAVDIVGDSRAAQLPRAIPGRAILRLGPAELVEFQVATTADTPPPPRRRLTVRVHADAAGTDVAPRSAASDPAPAEPATEFAAAVAAIQVAARRLDAPAPHRPWLDPLPVTLAQEQLAIDPVCRDGVGMVDDPARQCRAALAWDPAGNLLLIGSLGSGTSTALMAIGSTWCRTSSEPDAELFVIDGRGEPALDVFESLAVCAGVVRSTETERIHRLLCRLVVEIDARIDADESTRPVALLVDGLLAVRSSLAGFERADTLEMLDRVLADGAAVGVTAVATVDAGSPLAATLTAAERWVFHVDDPSLLAALGMRAAAVPTGRPGRLRVVSTGLEAQVVAPPTDPAEWVRGLPRRDGRSPTCRSIRVLPPLVDPLTLPPSECVTEGEGRRMELQLGLGGDDLAPAAIDVPGGDHVLIAGGPRTGRSTALRRVVAAWQQAAPTGVVISVRGGQRIDASLDPDALAVDRDLLVAVDDAERVDVDGGHLARLVAGRRPTVMVVAAVRLDAVRAAYGHWTREVARSRCGLILTAPGEVDGELLGVSLPRRSLIAPRPGLAWLIDRRGHRLVQVADRMPPCPASSPSAPPNSGRSSDPTIAPRSSPAC
jgi:S-DNA-T family DNA segregation ATPase FtsK/SpoIIIE